jgi:hypothetical protein
MSTARKYTDEQIVAILQEHHGGVTGKEIIRRHGSALALGEPERNPSQ